MGNLGRLAAYVQQWHKAEKYLLEGLEAATAVSHYELIILLNNSLGMVFGRQQKFDQAEQYFQNALQHGQKLDSRGLILQTLEGWGWLYSQMKKTVITCQFPALYPELTKIYELNWTTEEFTAACDPQSLEQLKIFYD